MKLRYSILATALLALAYSCSEEAVESPQTPAREFYASTESAVRVYSDAELQVFWNAADRIAVFDHTSAGAEYSFQGADGDKSGTFAPVSAAAAGGAPLGAAYAVYPYDKEVSIDDKAVLSLTIPARQSYVPGTFSTAANVMVAASQDERLAFRNVCGILSVRLTGNGTQVQSLELSGNGGEALAGPAMVSIAPGEEPQTTLGSDASKTIVLDCGSGVRLSNKDYTEFWFMVPPVELQKGFTVTVRYSGGQVKLERGKAVEIKRSRIIRMETISAEPIKTLGTGLRTVYIETPNRVGVDSKDNWIADCQMIITDDSGKVYFRNSEVSVKGRGNVTWGMPKKPYAIKLSSKEDLIGVGAKGKRWVLLANWMDRTLLRHDVAFEIARRTSLEWTPSGEFVELILNGKHQGNYWLGEQIKVGKGRLDADFLIEMDTYYDADWRFYSQLGWRVNQSAWGMPIGVKEPDDEDMNEELLAQLKGLVADVEAALYDSGDYAAKINVASFIDWYLVHEITANGEPNHPKSCYFYFRKGIMYAGPVWDFDWYTFVPDIYGLCIPEAIYFGQLMYYPEFVSALKARWAELKPVWADIPAYIDARAAEISASEAINRSMWPNQSYDVNGDCTLTYPQAITRMKNAFTSRLNTLDTAINNL